ncbi:hypothetical protein HYY75_01095, partial [bacterium]|nr:hypothetical protein [bacterium]
MDDKYLPVLATITLVLICLLFLGLWRKSGQKSKIDDGGIKKPSTSIPHKGPKEKEPVFSAPSVSPAFPVSPVTQEPKEALQKMAQKMSKRQVEIEKTNQAWLQNRINDTSLATQTREVYRLRMIPDLKKGHKALQAGDKIMAMQYFQASLKDPNASPVSKYVTLNYMIDLARQAKDVDQYFSLRKLQATLA